MGSAVSSVMGALGGGVSSVVSPVTGAIGGAAASAIGPILNQIAGLIPNIPIADQSAVQQQIGANAGLSSGASNTSQQLYQIAGQQYANTQGNLNASQNAINTAQQTALGGNVQNSLGLLQQQAMGTAPSAAQSVLQSGKNQAIAQQQAMANSGNASQMISGQKTAMDNAAQLTQQAANQATQLQATQQQVGQQNYASAAAQQAAQTAQNAGLSQQQAAQNVSLYGTQLGAAQNVGQQALTGAGNALTGQTNALGIQQGAMSQSGQNLATAIGGGLNAVGSAATALSDEDSKYNIDYASGENAGLPMVGLGGSTGSAPSSMIGMSGEQESGTNQGLVTLGKGISSMGAGITSGGVKQWQAIPLASDANQKYDITRESQDDSSSQGPNAGSQIKKGFVEGSGYTMSDEKSKKDIGSDKKDKISHFLDAIDAVSFKYKRPDGEMGKTPGEHLGVIAQQVEKAPGGKSMIVETPQGKGIDLASAVGTLMAAAAQTHDRVKDLEALFQSKRRGKK